MSAVPSSRSPVPASRIRSDPVLSRTSTQAVLPPYRTVSGPGVGIEPRVPQKRIFIGRSGARCLIALGEARLWRSGHSLVTGFGPGVLHGVERPLEVVDVPAHGCDDGRVELPRLEKKLVAYRDLAVVVEQRGGADLLELYPLKPERPPDDLRVSRHTLAVTGGLLIACVDRHRERLDERRPETPLLGDELRVLDRNGRRCPERAQRFLVVRRERATPVLVHDLEYTDDAIVLSGHRECEQRL